MDKMKMYNSIVTFAVIRNLDGLLLSMLRIDIPLGL